MGDFTVAPAELATVSGELVDAGAGLAATTVTAPDMAIFGPWAGAAGADAEPATTDDVNALLTALGGAVIALGERLAVTGQGYEALEADNGALADGIVANLTGGLRTGRPNGVS
ncbi:hypothetical protein [Microlunatus sp. Y2014]|uniref:hypothetical protein n=1 Tax=Microlunatus sp. Y2014 TaxID=3418488 RepID=UPI003DA75981